MKHLAPAKPRESGAWLRRRVRIPRALTKE